MTELQSMLLDMFRYFHSFCEEKHLTYYALGGTTLGAVRHQGFIPWDDDIDVGMPRKDYERFISMKEEFRSSRYLLEAPDQKNKAGYLYCKIYDTATLLIENQHYQEAKGIYLDVFPLDGIGQSRAEGEKNFKKLSGMMNLFYLRACAIAPHRSLVKNAAIAVSRCIPLALLDHRKLAVRIDRGCASRDFDSCAFGGCLMGNWGKREIMEREWFGTPTLLPFEDTVMYCPENTDAYLTQQYGDYRKLPPKEKQVTHHDYVAMDLHRSYLEP